MKKKIIWGVIVVVLIIVGIFIYRDLNQSYCWPYCPEVTDQDSDGITTLTSTETRHLVKVDISEWKTFAITDIGVEFKYPEYYGDVIVKKTDRTSCPGMKAYAANGVLPSQDYIISFSQAPKIGTGGSYVESYFLVAKTENSTNYCGLDILELKKKLPTDPWYSSSVLSHPSATEAYVSDIGTPIGTSVNQFYSLYFISRNQTVLIQPLINFIPYANSIEWAGITERQKTEGPFDSIVNFVKEDIEAESIRSKFNDFEKIVSTIKFTN